MKHRHTTATSKSQAVAWVRISRCFRLSFIVRLYYRGFFLMLLQLDFTRRLLPRGACSCILYSMGVGYMDQEVELLAPAGGIAAFHAAVRGGADAVYLGLQSFNARRGADNFTIDTFADACAFAHLRGVNVYVTLNTAILPARSIAPWKRRAKLIAPVLMRSSCRISASPPNFRERCRRRACTSPRK